MRQTEKNIVALDIGTRVIKGLLGSHDDTASERQMFFELHGETQKTVGISKSGVIRRRDLLDEAVQQVCEALTATSGYDIHDVHILYTHPQTKFFIKTIGTKITAHNRGSIYITEEWLEERIRKIKMGIQQAFKTETCTYFAIHSILADGEEIVHDPYEYTATKSLAITYSFALSPSTFIESLRESIEKTAAVQSIKPTAAVNGFFLSEEQKERGAIVYDIGANITAITVYREGHIISMHTAPFGSNTITDNIALQQKIPIDEAEKLFRALEKDETVIKKKDIQNINKKLMLVVKKELLGHLKQVDPKKNLPGGIVLLGGGARYPYIEEIIKKTLDLYTSKAKVTYHIQNQQQSSRTLWQSAYALLHTLTTIQKQSGLENQNVSIRHRLVHLLNRISKIIH